MRTTSRLFQFVAGLLGALGPEGLWAAPPVSQSWATRIHPPPNAYFRAAGFSVSPSGDVYVAGQSQAFWVNPDLWVSRYNSSGVRLWEKRYEPAEGLLGAEIASGVLAHGAHVYVAGTITPSTATSSQDSLTLKYSDAGTLEWAASLDGPGGFTDLTVAMAVDAQDNVLVVGDSIGTNGGFNIVVLKYGSSGGLLWSYSYDGPEHGPDRATGIRLDDNGNVYVAGTSSQGSSLGAAVTFKLSPDGQQLWVARQTSDDIQGISAVAFDVDAMGNAATVGIERMYCVTWKYDANGQRQWMNRYRAEEPASLQARDVQFDVDGNLIVAANLYGDGTNDGVLIKYTATGQQLWATRIASPNGVSHLEAFDVDGDGNAYVVTSPVMDIVTTKVASNGAQLWSVAYNSEGAFDDYGQFLDVAASGDIIVAGNSTLYSTSFVSLVKYTQQPVAGIATAVVTPSLQVVDPGVDVMFTAGPSGPGPVHFQWRRNGRVIDGATNATFAITNVAATHRGDYSVMVSNPAGATVSPEARLSVLVPPIVSVAPTQTLAYVGTEATFTATVAGNDFVTLQWRHDGTNLVGATNDLLRLHSLTAADAGRYDVVATAAGGSSTSSAAGLRLSGAVKLIGTTLHRSASSTWEYAPRLRVLPSGEFLIAARSNRVDGSSVVLTRHDASGSVLWSSVFESVEFTNAEPSNLVVDGAGNSYITGVSRQPYLAAALAVLKFSPDGQLLWSRLQTGTNLWSAIHAFAVDAAGNSTIGALSSFGVALRRYNGAGEVQWTFVDSSPDIDTISVAVDASGNTYLGTTLRVGGDNEIWLRKFDAAGTTAWVKRYDKGMYNRLDAIAVDSTGHLVIVGTSYLGEVPETRMLVAKYSSTGDKVWETRTGDWPELAYVVSMAVGPGDEITVLTESDDDYSPGEQSGVTRIGADGQLKYRVAEPQLLAFKASQLTLDGFGNAYVTGTGYRPATGTDVVTVKYDAHGHRPWLVYHGGIYSESWEYGLEVGVDAAGDVRVLTSENTGTDIGADFSVLHYRQRDPAGLFRVQIIPGPNGTFHLGVPAAGQAFQIESSADLQNWSVLTETERQQLLQPGGGTLSGLPQRFFRLTFPE